MDHFPVIEGGGLSGRGSLPFRFENMWVNADGFKNIINEWWPSNEVRGSGSYVLIEKLKALKVKLKIWNRQVFGRVDEREKVSFEEGGSLGCY